MSRPLLQDLYGLLKAYLTVVQTSNDGVTPETTRTDSALAFQGPRLCCGCQRLLSASPEPTAVLNATMPLAQTIPLRMGSSEPTVTLPNRSSVEEESNAPIQAHGMDVSSSERNMVEQPADADEAQVVSKTHVSTSHSPGGQKIATASAGTVGIYPDSHVAQDGQATSSVALQVPAAYAKTEADRMDTSSDQNDCVAQRTDIDQAHASSNQNDCVAQRTDIDQAHASHKLTVDTVRSSKVQAVITGSETTLETYTGAEDVQETQAQSRVVHEEPAESEPSLDGVMKISEALSAENVQGGVPEAEVKHMPQVNETIVATITTAAGAPLNVGNGALFEDCNAANVDDSATVASEDMSLV